MSSMFAEEGLKAEDWEALKVFGHERSIPKGQLLIEAGEHEARSFSCSA